MKRAHSRMSSIAGTLATMILPLASQALAAPPATQPVHPGSRMIANDHLAVELMDPADERRYNRGVRFTPLAAVVRVNCDGREFLFHRAQPDPLTDVAGLFAEFDLIGNPPGFQEAEVGQPFVKIGVGRLGKTGKDYKFFSQHPVVELAQTKTIWRNDTVEFEQSLSVRDGYGYRLTSKVSLESRTLTVAWTLANTGSKQLMTNQYAHNSFAFDNGTISPKYVVEVPFDFTVKKLAPWLRQQGRTIVVEDAVAKPANVEIAYPENYSGANTVTVRNDGLGLAVHCETSLPGQRLALHIDKPYVCPEQFIELKFQPGESLSWTRRYSFEVFQPKFDEIRR